MKFLFRFAPTLLLATSVLVLAHFAQGDVSAKTVVRSEEASSLVSPLSCSPANTTRPAEIPANFAKSAK